MNPLDVIKNWPSIAKENSIQGLRNLKPKYFSTSRR